MLWNPQCPCRTLVNSRFRSVSQLQRLLGCTQYAEGHFHTVLVLSREDIAVIYAVYLLYAPSEDSRIPVGCRVFIACAYRDSQYAVLKLKRGRLDAHESFCSELKRLGDTARNAFQHVAACKGRSTD